MEQYRVSSCILQVSLHFVFEDIRARSKPSSPRANSVVRAAVYLPGFDGGFQEIIHSLTCDSLTCDSLTSGPEWEVQSRRAQR